MKVAVPYNTNDTIYEHYGRVDQFKIYDIENRKIVNTEFMLIYKTDVIETAKRLSNKNVDIVICGNIGDTAKEYVYRYGMILFAGVSGNCDDAVNSFIEGTLNYDEKLATEPQGEDGDEVGGCCCGHDHEHHDHDSCSCGCGDGGSGCGNGCGCDDGCGSGCGCDSSSNGCGCKH